MYRKIILIFVSIFVVSFSSGSRATAEEPIRVFLHGNQVVFTQLPLVEDGNTLVQFRPLFESLNYTITWNGENQSIIAKSEKTEIQLIIGNSTASVNGESRELSIAPRIINGDTFVPLRFIGEASGGDVSWEQETNHVTIVTDKGYYLNQASLKNDLDKVKYWLDQGANPNYYSHLYNVPLGWAIFHQNTDMAKLLLKYHADPNYNSNIIRNLLHHTINYKNPEMVQVLIDGGADIWKKNSEGNAALAYTNTLIDSEKNESDKNNLLKIQSILLESTNTQAKIWSEAANFESEIVDSIREEFKGDIEPFLNEKTQTMYGLQLSVPRQDSKEKVKQLKSKIAPLGYKIYFTGSIYVNSYPEQVVVIKNNDTEFLKQLGAIGTQYDVNAVLKQLEKWNGSTKLEVMGASDNWVVVQLLQKPADILAFAKEVYAFNPDYVDFGTGSVEVFAKEIEKAQGFILWWPKSEGDFQ